MDKIFWMDAFEGKAIKKLEEENGLNIVGIKIDGGWTTEFIVEKKELSNEAA